MGLQVYNSLTRQLEDFAPLDPPHVGMYVCGPTVYGHSHLGHAKSYVSFDAIVRWLRFRGYDVNFIQNITDVGHLTDDADDGEDKVIAEARRRRLHPMAVVEIFMRSFFDDMDALYNVRPDIMPRATGHVPEQIELIQRLIDTNHAYVVNGSVYFAVDTFPEYGKLSGRRTEELEAGARVAVNSEKRNPADFALWKRAEESHIMRWPSPWGPGFPGWHLECSAMSQKYLGDTFDIHGGGMENKFPHHECEIAQSEAATGRPFARYWLHNNMCTVDGQKMGKSLGNSIRLKEIFYDGHPRLEQTFEPVVVKHFILTSHYRAPIDFSNTALQAAESGSYKLRDALFELEDAVSSAAKQSGDAAAAPSDSVRAVIDESRQRFTAAMDADFGTPQAIATMFDFSRQSNQWVREAAGHANLSAAYGWMRPALDSALGFRWKRDTAAGREQRDQVIRILADLRQQARKDKNFPLSDDIRNRLLAIGIELRDTPGGVEW
jgi:cysteinyl-tRNA synthetase